jgi:hypothetical protein
MKRFVRGAGPGLVAGLASLLGAFGVYAAFFYLGEWPTKNPFDQVFYAAISGVVIWIVVSVSSLRGFADVRSADAATYRRMRTR